MKNILTIISLSGLIIFSSCGEGKKDDSAGHISPDIINNPATASGNKPVDVMPKFEFEETNFDFGSITSGEIVTHEFKYKNIGDADLVISQAKGSCGCTEPEYEKNPIKPGQSSTIKITFNSDGIAGQLSKTVTILANTIPNTKVLTISAEVLKKNK